MYLNEDKKVVYNNKVVKMIFGCHIRLEDNTEILDHDLAYKIADFWKSEIEKDIVYAPEVILTLEDCKNILKSMPNKKFFYKAQLVSYIAKYKHIKPSEYIKSSYDPRDNDYCDSSYMACTYRQSDDFVYDFIDILSKNGYITKMTQTTIYFRK